VAASNAAAFTAAVRGTDDAALFDMSQAQALDREALDRLIATAQGAALRYGMLVCGNVADAEDAMQDALLQVYRHAGELRNPNAFRTWLYRTVKNACLMSRRTRVGEPPRLLSIDDEPATELAAADADPEELLSSAVERERVHRAVRSLPEPYRLVLFLRDLEGLSTEQVASVAGITQDNVKQRLHRARAMLRKELSQPARS
jgi:RNA polymerase sigma-70 factor, ECF subfamily